jgi:hypothetical protein
MFLRVVLVRNWKTGPEKPSVPPILPNSGVPKIITVRLASHSAAEAVLWKVTPYQEEVSA